MKNEKFFYYCSVATHPMLFTLAVLAVLFLEPPASSRLGVVGELVSGTFFFVAAPFSLLYSALKKKEITLHLEDKEKRARFFLPWATIFAGALGFYLLFGAVVHAALALSLALAMLFLYAANKKTKVSWHATGLAALITALVFSYGQLPAALYPTLLLGACYARFKLGAHNVHQLALGALAGTLSSTLSFVLLASGA